MAVKTLYLTTGIASSAAHHALQDGGTAPATATMATGWTQGTTSANRYSRMEAGVERDASTFSSTVQPDGAPNNTLGDCFRTPSTLTGRFVPGNWTYNVPVIASASSSKTGRPRIRLWRSTDATGAGATEIGTVRALPETNADDIENTATLVVSEAGFALTGEYLFVQVAWQVITTSGLASADVLLRTGSGANAITTNFAPPQTVAISTATETDTARAAMAPLPKFIAVGKAIETDLGRLFISPRPPHLSRLAGAWAPTNLWVRKVGAWTRGTRRVRNGSTWT